MIRKTVLYSGRVQGVGFRFTTHRLASRFNVRGYVRNLSDGRVELVAEGDRDEVERFLAAVAECMGDHIEHVQQTEDSLPGVGAGQFTSFDIRY